jgi:endoglucanase
MRTRSPSSVADARGASTIIGSGTVIVDPAGNYALEVHQYVDRDSSGRSDEIVSPEIGAQRLNEFTQWAKQHNKRGFLGEFAVANSRFAPGDIGAETLTNMLDHMDQNADVWLGWTWWAAGPWWGEYLFSIQPIRLGHPDQQDRPAMRALETRLAGARDRAAPP